MPFVDSFIHENVNPTLKKHYQYLYSPCCTSLGSTVTVLDPPLVFGQEHCLLMTVLALHLHLITSIKVTIY